MRVSADVDVTKSDSLFVVRKSASPRGFDLLTHREGRGIGRRLTTGVDPCSRKAHALQDNCVHKSYVNYGDLRSHFQDRASASIHVCPAGRYWPCQSLQKMDQITRTFAERIIRHELGHWITAKVFMVSLSCGLPGSTQNPRMNPCPSARPGEGEQEENRQGGPPGLQRAQRVKIGGCRFCSCWGCQGSALASPIKQIELSRSDALRSCGNDRYPHGRSRPRRTG